MKCVFCNKELKNIRALSSHLSIVHKYNGILKYMIDYEDFIIPKCKHCDNNAKHKNGLTFLKTCGCKKCISKENSLLKHSEETKQLLRKKRLYFLKNNPEHTAWRKRNKPSYPERCFINACLKYELIRNFDIEREKSFFPYYADFSFNNAKIVVEIDGSQHLLKERKINDDLKDKVIIDSGWRIFRITANEIKYNSDECIKKLLEFIGNDFEKIQAFGSHIKKESIKNREIKNKKILEKIIKKHNDIEAINIKLLNSGIDFSKFGWVNKASNIIGITPQKVNTWMKREMPEFYEECFKRKK